MSAVPAPGSVTTIFIVAGEHSGDALGAKLMAGLKTLGSGKFRFAGVGGHEMEGEGLVSLFPIEDVAVMGPLNILKALPRLRRRVLTTVDAAIAAQPDVVIIIDSPEFTHPITKRIRRRAPHIPIIDYVSPSVWAWRPGRAKKMRAYVDEILALLPFEPEAHERLGGPHCTYVGHPLIERLPDIASADAAALAARAGIALGQPVLLALPGSRRSEVERLVDVFGETVAVLRDRVPGLAVVIPAVAHVRPLIEARSKNWKIAPIIVDGHADKYAAMKLARAALAASGTVTLELALANLPMAVAYKVDPVAAPFLRRMIKAKTVVLANLVLGENAFPEFLQEDCNAARLANALIPLLGESPERRAQLAALARIPARVALPSGMPSEAAARAVLRVLGE
ncbi:MAG: lipid-A-disaccharide synthase [Hyphomicrobium sp.]|nr:lipid-A-disaccharide synthase [Hyphomicrobium sp.]